MEGSRWDLGGEGRGERGGGDGNDPVEKDSSAKRVSEGRKRQARGRPRDRETEIESEVRGQKRRSVNEGRVGEGEARSAWCGGGGKW